MSVHPSPDSLQTISPNTTVNTPSQISIHPSHTLHASPSASHHLIFFITGNPGLIGYYNTFLHSLHNILSTSQESQATYHIHGQSLAGFVDSDAETKSTPYSLEEQIEITLSALKSQRIPSGPRTGQHYDSVILIGHSVGSYILLELIKRLGRSSPVKISAGILLFPTVTHIAKSPSGVKISTLFRIPDFPKKVGTVAKGLVYLAPGGVLPWLVGLVARMPKEAADVTTSFLRSRMGVWQAL